MYYYLQSDIGFSKVFNPSGHNPEEIPTNPIDIYVKPWRRPYPTTPTWSGVAYGFLNYSVPVVDIANSLSPRMNGLTDTDYGWSLQRQIAFRAISKISTGISYLYASTPTDQGGTDTSYFGIVKGIPIMNLPTMSSMLRNSNTSAYDVIRRHMQLAYSTIRINYEDDQFVSGTFYYRSNGSPSGVRLALTVAALDAEGAVLTRGQIGSNFSDADSPDPDNAKLDIDFTCSFYDCISVINWNLADGAYSIRLEMQIIDGSTTRWNYIKTFPLCNPHKERTWRKEDTGLFISGWDYAGSQFRLPLYGANKASSSVGSTKIYTDSSNSDNLYYGSGKEKIKVETGFISEDFFPLIESLPFCGNLYVGKLSYHYDNDYSTIDAAPKLYYCKPEWLGGTTELENSRVIIQSKTISQQKKVNDRKFSNYTLDLQYAKNIPLI